MANCYYNGKGVRGRANRDREVKLSCADIKLTVTDTSFQPPKLKHESLPFPRLLDQKF